MKGSTLARPLLLHRPWPQRLFERLSQAGATGLAVLHGWSVRWHQARRLRREHEALRELDPATLRDLGAPPWLQADAQAYRESQRFERALLSLQGGVDGDHRR
jgi:hypothetical protein